MAELRTLARPYAKAAFEYALAHDELKQWSRQLGLAAAVAGNEKVGTFLDSPVYGDDQKADTFIELGGEDYSPQVANLLRLMVEHHRLTLLPEVSSLFEEYKAEQEKSLEVGVTSAFALTTEQQQQLTKVLSQRLSREVQIKTDEDPSLIGGVVIRAGDLIIDGSVRGRIAKLAEALKS